MRGKFANFQWIFKNTDVSRQDIGPLRQEYTDKELISQLRQMLNSSFELNNGTIITPLLLFNLEMGIVSTKNSRFVEYTPVKQFNKFVQSGVTPCRQGDGNANSSVVAETKKLFANSPYSYQIMDRIDHSVTSYMKDESTHAAIDNKKFDRLDISMINFAV